MDLAHPIATPLFGIHPQNSSPKHPPSFPYFLIPQETEFFMNIFSEFAVWSNFDYFKMPSCVLSELKILVELLVEIGFSLLNTFVVEFLPELVISQ